MSHVPYGADSLLIKSPRWARTASAASPRTDKSLVGHPEGAGRFMSHERSDAANSYPCQPVPDQPPQDSKRFIQDSSSRIMGAGHPSGIVNLPEDDSQGGPPTSATNYGTPNTDLHMNLSPNRHIRVYADMGRLYLCSVHRRRIRPAHRGVERGHHHGHRSCDGAAADGAVATRPRRAPD